MQKHEFKDRGNIKWTAMMLPEHREMLHEYGLAQDDVDPPGHDEYELAELAEKLARAKQDEELVRVLYWKHKRYVEVHGIIKKIDPYKRAILVDASTKEDWDQRWIPAGDIFGVDP